MLPRPVHAVIFDMDGLLIDSESVFCEVMTRAALDFGRELPRSVYLSMIGLPPEESRKVAAAHFGQDFSIDAYNQAIWKHANARHESGVLIAVKPGVTELLDELDRRNLPRAVATSSAHATVKRSLGSNDLLHRFNAIVAAGDYARGKPNPDPFLTAAERLSVDPKFCLALEDSYNGVRAAHAAGMMTVMVPDLLEATEEMHGLCIAVHADLHAIRTLLDRVPPGDA